jgi:hypothetical protein
VLILVAGLGFLLRRSITRPLGEVSEGARMPVRAMNVAVEDNRLDQHADVAAFQGGWAELRANPSETLPRTAAAATASIT